MAENNESKTAYFAGGCFWCITPAFAETEGVLSVTAGYCGGDETDPGYETVKQQRTGHRETVAILYDPAKVTYRTLLDVYLKNVDPLDATGQFIDKGRSYTLAVYYRRGEERAEAAEALHALGERLGSEPCIALEEYKRFYPAEEYHQNFYLKEPEAFEREMIASGRRTGK